MSWPSLGDYRLQHDGLELHYSLSPSRPHLFTHIFTTLPSNFTRSIVVRRNPVQSWIIYHLAGLRQFCWRKKNMACSLSCFICLANLFKAFLDFVSSFAHKTTSNGRYWNISRSSFRSTSATSVWVSSVCFSLHAACHINATQYLHCCHLDISSLFCLVTQRSCLSTSRPASKPLPLFFTLICCIILSLWSFLCFRTDWENFIWTRMGFTWTESLSFSCLSMWMRSSPEG